jgi:hypothetical protein
MLRISNNPDGSGRQGPMEHPEPLIGEDAFSEWTLSLGKRQPRIQLIDMVLFGAVEVCQDVLEDKT